MTDKFGKGKYIELLTFVSVSEMQRAGDHKDGQVAMLLGRNSLGDGEMRFYKWDGTSTASDESSSSLDVIKATNQDTGRWVAIDGQDVETQTGDFTASGGSKAGKTYKLDAASGQAVTLPDAVGSGVRYDFVVDTTITSNSTTIKAPDSDNTFVGNVHTSADGGDSLVGWEVSGSDDTLTLDGSTTGGIKGDRYTFIDIGTDLWLVLGTASATGTEADPFSATV